MWREEGQFGGRTWLRGVMEGVEDWILKGGVLEHLGSRLGGSRWDNLV